MHKKGNNMNAILNPLITRFIGTKEYRDICDKWNLTDDCYKTEFFEESVIDYEKVPYLLETVDMLPSQSCATGYCHCDAFGDWEQQRSWRENQQLWFIIFL